jgi:hypothetical protein
MDKKSRMVLTGEFSDDFGIGFDNPYRILYMQREPVKYDARTLATHEVCLIASAWWRGKAKTMPINSRLNRIVERPIDLVGLSTPKGLAPVPLGNRLDEWINPYGRRGLSTHDDFTGPILNRIRWRATGRDLIEIADAFSPILMLEGQFVRSGE